MFSRLATAASHAGVRRTPSHQIRRFASVNGLDARVRGAAHFSSIIRKVPCILRLLSCLVFLLGEFLAASYVLLARCAPCWDLNGVTREKENWPMCLPRSACHSCVETLPSMQVVTVVVLALSSSATMLSGGSMVAPMLATLLSRMDRSSRSTSSHAVWCIPTPST